tara:strand:- start:2285 stop:2455 length:171 start_codon:yes stop_codon:yes gene_type:complete
MKLLILLFLIVASCSLPLEKKTSIKKINIYENLSFDEFKSRIINYSKNSDFPDIKN